MFFCSDLRITGQKLRWNQVRNLSGPATVSGERNHTPLTRVEKGDEVKIREPGDMHVSNRKAMDFISDYLVIIVFYAVMVHDGVFYFPKGDDFDQE